MHSDDLQHYFLQSFQNKHPSSQYLGMEYEKFVILPAESQHYQSLPISGEPSVQSLLRGLSQTSTDAEFPWQPQYLDQQVIGLRNERGQTITVEPGGQIELSGAPLASLSSIQNELFEYLQSLSDIIQSFHGQLLFVGVNPFASLEQVSLLDKPRYRVMFPHMKTVGSHGQWMMKLTASTQNSIDYFSIDDLERKFVFFNRLSPFLTAIYANSPLAHGKESGFKSFRAHIWLNTDPYRSGTIPPEFLSESFRLQDYIDWALQASPYLLERDGDAVLLTDTSFGHLISHPHPKLGAVTPEDWSVHLGTLFPEVRIKRIIEIRSIDVLPPQDLIAVPALLQPLAYNESLFEKINSLLMDLPQGHYPLYQQAAAKDGLDAEVHGLVFADFAKQLFEIVMETLGSDIEEWLMPYFETYVKHKKSPADLILEEFHHAQNNVWQWLPHYLERTKLQSTGQ